MHNTSQPEGVGRPASRWVPFRTEMPVTENWVYFDHAAVAPLPLRTVNVLRDWISSASEQGDTAWPEWSRAVNATRKTAAALIAAERDEIALVPSTTAGITLIAEGFPWRRGDNVVTAANEFPSNQYPWMNLADRGVETRRVEIAEDGRVDLDRLLSACDDRTRIVSLSWIGYASGFRIDLPKFTEAIHGRGAYFFLDAIQGMGVFPLDVQQTPIDFLAADGHKWMLGPEGAGVLYIRREHLDRLRPIGVGWNSVVHSYDFGHVELTLKAAASRYEGGTLNTAGFLALGASLDLLREHGVRARTSPVADRILEVTRYAYDQLAGIDAEIVAVRQPPHDSGILSFRLPNRAADQLRNHCLRQGIVLSQRNGCLRISPHAYNNEQEIDRLITVLQQPGVDA